MDERLAPFIVRSNLFPDQRFDNMEDVVAFCRYSDLRIAHEERFYIQIPPPYRFVLPPSENYAIPERPTVREQIIFYVERLPMPVRVDGDIYNITTYQQRYQIAWDHAAPLSTQNEPDKKVYRKARILFYRCLTLKEREELNQIKTITIETLIGLFRLIIDDADTNDPPAFNVCYRGNKYCLVLTGEDIVYPRNDHYAMQVMMIKSDPKKFLQLANKK